MARTQHTYAIRLAVDGGGRVRAELATVGESGQRSLRRIEDAGDRASRELQGLGRQTDLLKAGMRALGGALAGVATVRGMTMLIDRSLTAADAIGKTADRIGVGVEALQELRYAAQSAGVGQQTLEMALQRFTRRSAEAAQGTGEAREALAKLGIALKDQNGNIRRSEDLLGDVADALSRIEDPAERVRLAFKLFDSEGVALVNMLTGGSRALDAMRQRARDLGIVLEEDLIRNAETARNELDTLSQVISANLTRAVLDLAPAIADASTALADFAADAGSVYEQLKLLFQGDFDFENLSLRSTQRIVAERRDELQAIRTELAELGEVAFLDDPIAWGRKVALEQRLQERVEQYRQWSAKLSWLQAEAERDRSGHSPAMSAVGDPPRPAAVDPASTPDRLAEDIQAAKDRAAEITRIESRLQEQLFTATHDGADRIRAEYARLAGDLEALVAPDGSNREQIDTLLQQGRALRDAQLAGIVRQESEAAAQRVAANGRIVAGLQAEIVALGQSERQRFIDQALRRLSAEATDEQRREVVALANALYDEREAQEAVRLAEDERQRLMDRGRSLTESLRTATEVYAAEVADLNGLLAAGAIDQETWIRAMEGAEDRLLRSSKTWTDGARRFLRDYRADAEDAASAAEQAFARAFGGMEDALVTLVTTGKMEFSSLVDSIMADVTRMAVRQAITGPLAGMLDGMLGGDAGAGLFGLFHTGGVVGATRAPLRLADPAVFDNAPRFHSGGIAGMGLLPDEVPIIARRGEIVVPPERVRREPERRGDGGGVTVVMNISTPDAGSFRQSQGQMAAEMARAIERARRNL